MPKNSLGQKYLRPFTSLLGHRNPPATDTYWQKPANCTFMGVYLPSRPHYTSTVEHNIPIYTCSPNLPVDRTPRSPHADRHSMLNWPRTILSVADSSSFLSVMPSG